MSGGDSGGAEPAQAGPARGRPCPLDAQVPLRCLMGSGCLQEPLTPRQGENSDKRLSGCPFPVWESPHRAAGAKTCTRQVLDKSEVLTAEK